MSLLSDVDRALPGWAAATPPDVFGVLGLSRRWTDGNRYVQVDMEVGQDLATVEAGNGRDVLLMRTDTTAAVLVLRTLADWDVIEGNTADAAPQLGGGRANGRQNVRGTQPALELQGSDPAPGSLATALVDAAANAVGAEQGRSNVLGWSVDMAETITHPDWCRRTGTCEPDPALPLSDVVHCNAEQVVELPTSLGDTIPLAYQLRQVHGSEAVLMALRPGDASTVLMPAVALFDAVGPLLAQLATVPPTGPVLL